MSAGPEVPVRDVAVVLHPELPQVLTGPDSAVDVRAPDGQPSWPELLAAVRAAVPGGAWPLTPQLRLPGLRVHPVQARTEVVAAGCRWSDAPHPSWPEPLQEAVRTLLAEDAGTTAAPTTRAAWMRRGWWAESTSWVDAQLAAVGLRRTGDLEPLQHWGISAVARVDTTGGAVWLKAVPPIFRREPAVLAVLASQVPGRVPTVLAADEGADTRFLMRDVGAAVPDDVPATDRPRLAALLADVQVRTLGLLPELVAAGTADRSPSRLASELARMAEDGAELHLLSETERAALSRGLPRLVDQVVALEDSRLPTVLVHGDFHPWNVARSEEWTAADAVILDWTDAATGPAGVDLATLLPRSAGEPERAATRQAYADVLAAHLDIAPADAVAAVAATTTAAHVVQALAYDELLRAVEPAAGWQLAGPMAAHLRSLAALG